MVFWISIIVLVVGIVWLIKDDLSSAALGLTILGSIATIVVIFALAFNYSGVDGYVAKMETRYEMLTYQLENEFYENDNDVGKYELVSKIQDWNEDLSYRKTMQRNFWIGIFIPNIYDQFEYIPLEGK